MRVGVGLISTFLGLALSPHCFADAHFSSIFQSGMVLQQGNKTRLYGSATAGETVSVTVGSVRAKTKAGVDGKWNLTLKMPPAGGPYTVSVKGETGEAQSLDNVLVGEVWVCSGQSNMEWAANWFNGRRFEIGESDLPNVRLFLHQHRVVAEPTHEALGTWETANRVNARNFSLIGFLFGRKLNKDLNVPVGLIESAWGGTPAESWTDIGTLRTTPGLETLADKFDKAAKPNTDIITEYQAKLAKWEKDVLEPAMTPGAPAMVWSQPGLNESDWTSIELPKTIEAAGLNIDGAIWFRKAIQIPAGFATANASLELGAIDDYDFTFINGVKVGSTGATTPNAWSTPRRYKLAAGTLHEGENVVAVRVMDTGGGGGFTGDASELKLVSGDKSATISLAGNWKMKVERTLGANEQRPTPPVGQDDPWLPSGLYNGMITSVAPYSVKGAIWYQGESNADRAAQYGVLFPAMIKAWRKLWDNPQLAFHFVQLASFGTEGDGTTESGWADLRESQTQALALPYTGMAVAIDVGEAKDIHPFKKDVVADRLARIALGRTYGKKVNYQAPIVKKLKARGSEWVISFENGSGLKTNDGGPVRGFAIAGSDKKFYVADARIEGDTIVVSNPNVGTPMFVRYGWADYSFANLLNGEGLAVEPFRTGFPVPKRSKK